MYASALKPDGTILLAGQSYNGTDSDVLVVALAPTQGSVNLASLSGRQFGVDVCQWGAGQLVDGSGAPFDGLGRLQVGGTDYKPLSACSFDDDGQTIITSTEALFGLDVHREVTVPNSGSEDFARTIDVFYNPTASPITTSVRIVGNLGSDAATAIWGTFDGGTDVETTDRWIGTDDVDGSGTPAMVHYIHGPSGLLPESVIRTGDNVEWTFNITVPAGQYVRLVHFTILADTQTAAEAAAATLVAAEGFGGQAGAFLTPAELATLLNFYNNSPPTIASLSSSPDPAAPSLDVTLAATGVNDPDPDGFVVSVAFYRESNGIPGLQTGGDGDTLLATDGNPADGWSTTFSTSGLRGGTYTYYARATDNEGAQSATGTAAIWTTNTVEAQYQIVSDATTVLTADPGQSVSFPVRYTTSTGDNTLPGLGLRMHFNSALLAYIGLSNVLPSPVQQQDPVADTADWDNDPTTDMYVFVSWADVGGNWPNQPLPVALCTATFRLSDGAPSGAETAVRFSASSLAAGYTFESRPTTVHARTITPSLDADGNGTVDALSDGILILRYLFDPAGTWNVNDALGPGATRTNRQQIKSFLDACTSTALDADGDNSSDALSDGILILRYLFDPGGAWRTDDVLGPEATRTSREAIKAYLDQFNFAVSPPPGLTAGGMAEKPATQLPAEDLFARSQVSPSAFASLAFPGAEPATSDVCLTDASRLGPVISQVVATDGTSTTAFPAAPSKSSLEDGQPRDLLPVDRAIEAWDQAAAEEITVRWTTAQCITRSNNEEADRLWGNGDLGWFLADIDEAADGQELGGTVLPLPRLRPSLLGRPVANGPARSGNAHGP